MASEETELRRAHLLSELRAIDHFTTQKDWSRVLYHLGTAINLAAVMQAETELQQLRDELGQQERIQKIRL